MGNGSSSNRSGSTSSLSHTAIGGSSRYSHVKGRRALKSLSSGKNVSAVTSAAGAGSASSHAVASSSLRVKALPTHGHHRDDAAGTMATSPVSQDNNLSNPVSPTRRHGLHFFSSLPTKSVEPSPARVTAAAVTASQDSSGERGHRQGDSPGRERPCGAELSPQQCHHHRENNNFDLAVIDTSNSCQACGDNQNDNGGAARSGSVVGAHCTCSSSMLQSVTDSAVPLPLTTVLSREDVHPTANIGTAPAPADAHTRGAMPMPCGGTEANMDKHHTDSSQVGCAILPATFLMLKDCVLPETHSFSCSQSTAVPPLSAGRVARSTNVLCHPSTTTMSTAACPRRDEPLNMGAKGVVGRGRRKSKSDLKPKPEGAGDGNPEGGDDGFWRRQSRNSLFRKLLSRSSSRAERSSQPLCPQASKEGGSVRGTKAKCVAKGDSATPNDMATAVAHRRTSAAQCVHDVPTTAPTALCTQQTSSSSSAGAAEVVEPEPTVPTSQPSSMTAQRISVFQPPAAEGCSSECTAVALTVDNVRSYTSGWKSPCCAADVLRPGLSEKEYADALPPGHPVSHETPHCLHPVPGEKAEHQGSDDSDSTTPTDTNLVPILPPPPTASFAKAAWGTRRAAAPATPTMPNDNGNMLSDNGHDNDQYIDCVAAATSPSSAYDFPHQKPRRRKAPGTLGAGPPSITTVTDTTARASLQSPCGTLLTAVAAAEGGGSVAAAAFLSSAVTTDTCLRGRRWVNQSAIIAAWNRMGARTTTPVVGIGVGGGHHGGGEVPESSAEALRMSSAPGKSVSAAGDSFDGGVELGASALPASREIQLTGVLNTGKAEVAAGAAPSFRHQCTAAGQQEAGDLGDSYNSRAVVRRQQGPPLLFSPSPENNKHSDIGPQPLLAVGPHFMNEVAPAAGKTASPLEPIKPANDMDHSWAVPPSQELHGPSSARIMYGEGEEPSADGSSPITHELHACLHTSTAIESAVVTQWPLPQEGQGSDTRPSTTQPLQAGILIPVNFEDRKGVGSFGEEQEHSTMRRKTVRDEEMAPETATTVDADEDDRVNEEGDATERHDTRDPQRIAAHRLQRQPGEEQLHRACTPGFTTTHATVTARSAATGLLSAHINDQQHYSPLRYMVSGASFVPSANMAASCGAMPWMHSSPSSSRSYNTSESLLEASRGAHNVEDNEDSLDEAGVRRTQDGEVGHRQLRRSEDGRVKRFVGLNAGHFSRNYSSPSVFVSGSDCNTFDAMAATSVGSGNTKLAARVRSNSCQRLPRRSKQELMRNRHLPSSTARVMPCWRERLTRKPQLSSPLSSSAAQDDVGGTASTFPATPRGRRGLTSQGAPPLAHQPSAHLHNLPPPLTSVVSSHPSQYLRREISGSLGSVRWKEVSLPASGGPASPNFGFATSSRGNDNTSPLYDTLGDDEEDLYAVANEDHTKDSGDDRAQRRQGCCGSGAVDEGTGEDRHDTFLCLGSNEVPTWGMATLQTWHQDNDDDDDRVDREEEDDKGDTSESGARNFSNAEGCSNHRECLRSPQHYHWEPCMNSYSPSTRLPKQQPQESSDVGGASREFHSPMPCEYCVPPSRIVTRTFLDSIVCLQQPRYEPPMPSNRNTFTAFVHLSDISSSQLLATTAAAPHRGFAHFRCTSSGVQGDEAAATSEDYGDAAHRAVPRVQTPATVDTLILNGDGWQDARLADGADVREDVVDVAYGALPVTPLSSSLSTAPTHHISRANTPVLVTAHGALARQASQSAETEAARTRPESPSALFYGIPPQSRSVTTPPQRLSHASAAAVALLKGGSDDFKGEHGAGSDHLSVPVAQLGATSLRTSLNLESMRLSAVLASQGERRALSDGGRPCFDTFGHSTALVQNAADAGASVAVSATMRGHIPKSAQLSPSQSLPWWNRHRRTIQLKDSDALDQSQRGGENRNGGGGHSPYRSPLSADSVLASVLGGRAESPVTHSGSVAINGSPLGHIVHAGDDAVASVSFRMTGGRLLREAQYPTPLTNECHWSAFRSSGGTNGNGGDAAHSVAAGAALCHTSHDEMLIKQRRSCDVGDRGDEGRVSEEEDVEAGVALGEKCISHDYDVGISDPPDVCMQAPRRHALMPVSASFSSGTSALRTGTARAQADSKGALATTASAQAMATVTVAPPTLSFIEEAEVRSRCKASQIALASSTASVGPRRGEAEPTSDKEAVRDGAERAERSEVDPFISLSLDIRAHHTCSVSNTIPVLTKTAVTTALDDLGETEMYTCISMEENATDAQDARVSVFDTLQPQHEHLPLQQQSTPVTDSFVLPFALSGVDILERWASAVTDSVAGGGGSDSGRCRGGSGITRAAGGATHTGSKRIAPMTAASLTLSASRGPCDSLVSPSHTSERPLMLKQDVDADGGNGDTGSAPGPFPSDEYVSGVVAADSSGVTGAHDAEGGDVHDGRAAPHADIDVEAEKELPHPPLATTLIDSLLTPARLATSHRSTDIRRSGLAVRVDQRDTSLDERMPLTVQQYSPESSRRPASGTSGLPVSPDYASLRSPLLLQGEASVDACPESRTQTPPDHHYGPAVLPSPHHEDSTSRVYTQSRSQRQHSEPSVGRTVCRWCGEPYASADVCPTVRRPHKVLREERRIEKTAKRTAQTLLREGRITEAVELLKSAGICV